MLRAHQKLQAWQVAMKLATDVYEATSRFPTSERFGLTAQMRRAAVSIPSSLAEGAARRSTKEFRRYLLVARGPLAELHTQVSLSESLELLDESTLKEDINQLFPLLNGLIRKHSRGP